MKQRIEIRNFGPIKKVDLDISDYTLFIGPNASGKSTIAKLVYFCRVWMLSASDVATDWLFTQGEKGNKPESIINRLCSEANFLFCEIWDIESVQNNFEVHFYCNEKNLFSFRKNFHDKSKIQILLGGEFKASLEKVIEDCVIQPYNELINNQVDHNQFNFAAFMARMGIGQRLGKYNLNQGVMFIPAGRQAFAIPRDERPTFSQDFFMSGFYEHIKEQKKDFRNGITQKVFISKENSFSVKQIECLELVCDLTSRIIKGEYVSLRDDERIYFSKVQYVKLYEASSGQQEALWILNSIFTSIEQKQERFTIIEEPEAHLYPETQRDVTNLISLLANQPGNQVMITTHSPYILSALNNLLYAHKAGKTKPDEVSEIVDPLLWLNLSPDRVAAYKVENGEIHDIIDPELGMINAEEIDSASRTIFDELDKILQLED